MNPFSEKYDRADEMRIVREAQGGSRQALERLITLHQHFIFNVALKFVRNPDDAADLSQEAIIKMITSLNQFKGKSSFRTWLYRIVVNHFLNSKSQRQELQVRSFEEYGKFLDNAHADEEMTPEEQRQYNEEVRLTRDNCMTSMLLCLDRRQRVVFVLGAIFKIRSNVAARLLSMTAGNFRQQLARAKADLFTFMEGKCGLINPNNPCRCEKKTKGFIKEGLIDRSSRQFKPSLVKEIKEIAFENNKRLDDLIEGKYLSFFRTQPYREKDLVRELSKSLLFQKDILELFRLN